MPPWIASVQTALIKHLAQAPDSDRLPDYLAGAIDLLRREFKRLRALLFPLEELLIAQRPTPCGKIPHALTGSAGCHTVAGFWQNR